ncbi:hypothetical protein BT93_B2764 [Corymbia citriodora subsp. variegata]|nr:hypothetical protein BT93_B2764 [Corymbia citriodora subsp. variegata]
MERYWRVFGRRDDMGSTQKMVLCVKRVKQEVPEDWDESMPLPGDIIKGFAEDGTDEFVLTKAQSEFNSQLGKMISQQAEIWWVKVRRGDRVIKLRACIVPIKGSMLQRKLTIQAARDDSHVVALGDLKLEQCVLNCEDFPFDNADMSRRVVNVDTAGFKKKGMRYDWKAKVRTYLPDHRSLVVKLHSSYAAVRRARKKKKKSEKEDPREKNREKRVAGENEERRSEGGTAGHRSRIAANDPQRRLLPRADAPGKNIPTGKEISLGKQHNQTMTVQMVHGMRIWFLPGIAEVSVELVPEPGDARFGMDIRRTEEGFICIFSVTKGSAADRTGLGRIHEKANAAGHLLVVSRLEGKSLMPSNACSEGLIHCCEHSDVREVLTAAIDAMDRIKIHIMGWPNQTRPNTSQR